MTVLFLYVKKLLYYQKIINAYLVYLCIQNSKLGNADIHGIHCDAELTMVPELQNILQDVVLPQYSKNVCEERARIIRIVQM